MFPEEELEWRALMFFVRFRQSRQALGNCFCTLSRNRTRGGMNEQASSWLSAVEGLPEFHDRLKRVVILNYDALDVIKQQDGPNTFFYLDPPYLRETRVAGEYKHEMSDEDHRFLLDALSQIKGKFLLSGNPSVMYDAAAIDYNWKCVRREIDNKASSKKVKGQRTECLWANYELTRSDA